MTEAAPAAGGEGDKLPFKIAGVAANDNADSLILRMLKLSLGAARVDMHILANPETPMKLNEEVAAYDPDMVVLSHVPPGGPPPRAISCDASAPGSPTFPSWSAAGSSRPTPRARTNG